MSGVVSRSGAIYFTDPTFGRTREDLGIVRDQELDFQGLFRVTAGGELELLDAEYNQPNGLCFSPAEDVLYVNDCRDHLIVRYDVGADGTRRTTRYDIDLFKCIFCGFCEEACPVDAIVETRLHEYHMENRGENIMSKDKLLGIGERYEAMIAADRAADARYR